VSVRDEDVRHVAALARIGVAADRFPALARELSGILAHMEQLRAVDVSTILDNEGLPAMSLRQDDGAQVPLARPREAFAPVMRDGFFVVPRLESHEDSGSSA